MPECAAAACHDARFDFELRQCTAGPRPDGEACETACVGSGRCSSGTCTGTLKSCDDAGACTVDAADGTLCGPDDLATRGSRHSL